MAPIDVPKGHGYIAGRSHENAVRALQAASDAGYADSTVLTRQGGYVVPVEVLDKYELLLQEEQVATAEEVHGDPEAKPENTEAAPQQEITGEETNTGAETGSESEQGEGEPAPESTEDPATEESTEDSGEPAPAGNASTAVWSEWAEKNRGYDPTEGLDRKALIERFGEKE